MKKRIIFWAIAILCVACVAVGCNMLYSEQTRLSWEEKEFVPTRESAKVEIREGDVIGINTEEQAVYLVSKNQDGQLQVHYQSLTNPNQDADLVYTSSKESAAYNTYTFGESILLLEVYYDETQKMAFSLLKISFENSETQKAILYEENCERMPYVAIVNVADTFDLENISPQVLLNYDSNGLSHLMLLHQYVGPGSEPIIINSGTYGRYEEGTIENGRKILFAGGYGDYVYYQVLYNSVGDPPPEVATFEATGTSVLFRYNIRTEEITRVMDLDKKALHINAGGNYALVSEYDYDTPLMDSGKLISLDNGRTAYIIPGVESGRDISASRFIEEDKVVFYTPKKLYLADLNNCVLHTYDLVDNTRVWLGQEGVHLVHSSNEQAEIQYIAYSDVFGID